MRPGLLATSVAALVSLTACGADGKNAVHKATLRTGSYQVVSGSYAPADAERFQGLSAWLDRSAGRLVLTLADKSEETMVLAVRPRDAWWPDCYTGAGSVSHFENEVADLSPTPLVLESLTFAAPVIHAECGPGFVLSDGLGHEPATWLALQPILPD